MSESAALQHGVDWIEVMDSIHTVYFTVRRCGAVLDISSYPTRTLKVWAAEATVLKFSGVLALVGGGTLGRCSYLLVAGDVDTEGIYFFSLELIKVGETLKTLRGTLQVTEGPPA